MIFQLRSAALRPDAFSFSAAFFAAKPWEVALQLQGAMRSSALQLEAWHVKGLEYPGVVEAKQGLVLGDVKFLSANVCLHQVSTDSSFLFQGIWILLFFFFSVDPWRSKDVIMQGTLLETLVAHRCGNVEDLEPRTTQLTAFTDPKPLFKVMRRLS